MRKLFIGLISAFLFTSAAYAGDGLVSVKSAHDVKSTADRLVAVLNKKGMTVFKRVNHTQGAKNVGIEMRPTEVVIFGNPKVGTPLMLCGQSMAIDLPQKALIWEDAAGQVWFTYNDPKYLAKRHGTKGCDKVVKKITGALAKFSKAATQ